MTRPQSSDSPVALDGVRVLDLTGVAGQYATKLLADLGADVVRIEPPGGAKARTRPPFLDDDPHPNRSIAFWYWNTSKRSVTLDLTTEDGRALFRRLLPRFDVLVHTFPPSEAATLGLNADQLEALHPGLIQCSITPFGVWGPHADYAGGDLIVAAMSGLMSLAGYPDRAPTMPPGEQAAVCGGIQAAQGVLMALYARDIDTPARRASGCGQRIEVSQQEAMSMSQETAMQTWDMRGELRPRRGETRLLPGYGTYECADGHVYCMVGVPGVGAPLSVLIAWMAEEGMAADLQEERWQSLLAGLNMREMTALLTQPAKLQEMMQKFGYVDEVVSAFFRTKRKHALYLGGQQRRLLVGPVNSAKDLRENEQLAARGWWEEVEHPELERTLTYPGAPYHHGETPWRIRRRPPLLGEHTLEVLEGELGLSREQTEMLMGAGVI
jgi:benzylsuccinate CoA-transferase BbsE subunit